MTRVRLTQFFIATILVVCNKCLSFQTLAKLGATSALVALSKTESKNIKELICRVINAICKFPELRGEVVQQVIDSF